MTWVSGLVWDRCQFLLECGSCKIHDHIADIPVLKQQCRGFSCHGANQELDVELARFGIHDVESFMQPSQHAQCATQNNMLVFDILVEVKMMISKMILLGRNINWVKLMKKYDAIIASLRKENDQWRLATKTLLLAQKTFEELNIYSASKMSWFIAGRFDTHMRFFESMFAAFQEVGIELDQDDEEFLQHYFHTYSRLATLMHDADEREIEALCLTQTMEDIEYATHYTQEVMELLRIFTRRLHTEYAEAGLEHTVVWQFSEADQLAIALAQKNPSTHPWYPPTPRPTPTFS